MKVGRRRFFTGAACASVGLLARPTRSLGGEATLSPGGETAFSPGGETPTLGVLGRWETGNATLSPLSAAQGVIHFTGDRSYGAIAPDRAAPLWVRDHALDGGAVFRPRIAGPLVIASGQHWMTAADRATGETVWTYRARTQTGVPLATPDLVCFGDGHEYVALDAATGVERWRAAGVPDTLASYAPAIAGDTVLACSGDGVLRAFRAQDGAALWSVERRAAWQYLRQLHVDGDVLVAGSYTEKLFGLSVHDGAELWTFTAGNFINSHHVADGAAYLWSPTGWVYAVDAQTGAVRWRHRTTGYDGRAGDWASLMAELVTQGGRLYALAMDNILHVLDAASGAETAVAKVPDRIRHAVLPLPGAGVAFPTTRGSVLLTEQI